MLSAERNSRAHSRSPSRTSNDQKALTMWKQQLTAYVAWVNSQLKKKAGAHLVEDLRHDIRDGVALVDLVEVIGGEVLEDFHPAPTNYAEMKENVDKVLQFMMEKHIKMHHITSRDIVEGNLKAIMRLILALAAHYKPNSVRHSSQTASPSSSTSTVTARQSNLNITGIAQGAAAALTEARRSANKAGYRHRRRRQKEEQQLQQQQYENQSCSDSDYAYGSSTPQHHQHHHRQHEHPNHHHHHHSHHHNHHRNSYPSSTSYSKTVRNEHGFTRSTSLMSSSVPTPRHHSAHTVGLTSSHSYQRALGEGEEGSGGIYSGGGTRGDLEGASGSSSPVNSMASPSVSLYMSDPPSSMEPIIDSSGALMSASCESDSLTDSGFNEFVHSVKETKEMLFGLHSLLLHGEKENENGAASIPSLEGTNPQEKMCVLKERLLNAEETSELLRTELSKSKKDTMELQATKLGLEQRLAEQENQLSTAKAELLKRELDMQHLNVEMESLKKQLGEKDQLLTDVKVSYVKQEDEKDKVMGELRREMIKRDQSIEILQEKLTYQGGKSSSADSSRKNSTSATPVGTTDRSKDGNASTRIPITRPGKLDLYVRKAAIGRPKHLSELEAVRDTLRVAKSSTARTDVTSTLECLEGNILSLIEKLNTSQGGTAGIHSNNHSESGSREYPRPWQQNRSTSQIVKSETTTSTTTPGRVNRAVSGMTSGIARGRLNQQTTPSRRPQQQQESSVTGSRQTADHASSSVSTPSKTNRPQSAKAGRSLIPLPPGSRLKTPSPTNTNDLNHSNNSNNHHHSNNNQQQQTEVLYYLEEGEKPFVCNIHKKLGEITLRDFKSLLEEPSLYHYYFKAADPEYGTVKEELCSDEDVLPGWEGKIIAWVMEQEGTVC